VADDILLTKGEPPVFLRAKYANRHGLVSGATGTGKTVPLMVTAEGLSRIGVPVFMADVKGDVAKAATPLAQRSAKSVRRCSDACSSSPSRRRSAR